MTTEEIAVKLQHLDDFARENRDRIEGAEKRLDDNAEMLASIARLDERQKDMDRRQGEMDGDIKEIKADVKSMAGKSGKRWDAIVDKAIQVITAALLAYALAQIGLG